MGVFPTTALSKVAVPFAQEIHDRRIGRVAKCVTAGYVGIFLSHAVGSGANTKGGMRGFAFMSAHLTEIDYYNDFDECMQTVSRVFST